MKDGGRSAPEVPPWQALLDSAGDGIWVVDLEGLCTFVNRAALAMMCYRADEVLGQNMHDLVHHHYPDGSIYPADQCVVYRVYLENEPLVNHRDHVFRKDGTWFAVEMSAQPIVDEGAVRGAVVIFRDITQALKADEALRRSEKLAAVGQLASSIAHEINNPLESVINLLYLIRTAESREDVKTYVTLAEQELARVADIALQTLRFHRQSAAAAPVDLGEMIAAVLRLYGSRFTSRKIEVKKRLQQTPPAIVLEGDLRQVLNNLIRNGHDAMPEGGTLHVRLRPGRCMRSGVDGVRMTVADTGTGFVPEMRQHLFEPFHTSKQDTGTGLGLWISKGIVDKHCGKIQMRSLLHVPPDERHGTVFSVWLPLVAPPGAVS